jgi:hypothetical protein
MKESDFDLTITKKVPELIQKYGLKYDPKVLIPVDDELAQMATHLTQRGLLNSANRS